MCATGGRDSYERLVASDHQLIDGHEEGERAQPSHIAKEFAVFDVGRCPKSAEVHTELRMNYREMASSRTKLEIYPRKFHIIFKFLVQVEKFQTKSCSKQNFLIAIMFAQNQFR